MLSVAGLVPGPIHGPALPRAFDPTSHSPGLLSTIDRVGHGAGADLERRHLVPLTSALRIENTTTPVGSGSGYEFVDPVQDEILVTNLLGNNVTVLDGSNYHVKGVLSVNAPNDGTYDPLNGYFYVASPNSVRISVINATSGRNVTTFSPAASPYDCTVDPRTGNLFVTDNGGGAVDVVNASTNKVVRTFGVGGYPTFEYYDNATDRLFVVGAAAGVATVNGTSGKILGYIPGTYSVYSGALDPTAGRLYLSNTGGNNITVVNATTGQLISAVGLGITPGALTVDRPTGFIFIANSFGMNITVLNATTERLVGVLNLPGYPGDAVTDPNSGAVYVDSGVGSSVTVLLPPVRASLLGSATQTDVRSDATFEVRASGGLPPYTTYNWSFGDGGTANGTLANTSHAYAAAGPFNVSVRVTDAGGYSGSVGGTIEVHPTPLVGPIRSNGTGVDQGGNATLTTNASLGIPPYRFHWTGLPVGCTPATAVANCRWPVIGTFAVGVSTTDSVGGSSPSSPAFSLVVAAAPAVLTPSANRTSADVGQSVDFSTTVLDGSPPYRFDWTGLPAGCSGASAAVTCRLSSPADLAVAVQAIDATGTRTLTSGVLPFPVDALPSAAVALNASVVDAGRSFELNAKAANGSGGYAYAWEGLPPGCVPQGAIALCNVPSSAGPANYTISVSITDSNGGSNASPAVDLEVVPSLTATSIEASGPAAATGVVTLMVEASGGQEPLSFEWSFGDGSHGNGIEVSHTYSQPGRYLVQVWINDSGGESRLESTVAIWPTPPPAPNHSSTLSSGEEIAGVAFAVLAAAIALLLVRRRRRNPSASPTRSTRSTASPTLKRS